MSTFSVLMHVGPTKYHCYVLRSILLDTIPTIFFSEMLFLSTEPDLILKNVLDLFFKYFFKKLNKN